MYILSLHPLVSIHLFAREMSFDITYWMDIDAAGYLNIINQMKELISRAGKKAYTLVMGRPNPAKLANFPEVKFD